MAENALAEGSPLSEASTGSKTRPRFNDSDAFLRVLQEFCVDQSPVDYGTGLEQQKMQRYRVELHVDLICALHDLEPRLVFGRKTIEKAVHDLALERNKVWHLNKSLLTTWTRRASLQIRTLCLHAAALQRHHPRPARWFSTLLKAPYNHQTITEQSLNNH